jgi:hypothetical protein
MFLAVLVVPLSAQATAAPAATCVDPHGVLTAFYAASDARRYDAGMKYFVEDATIDAWATGVNGYIMAKRHARRGGSRRLSDQVTHRHRTGDLAVSGPTRCGFRRCRRARSLFRPLQDSGAIRPKSSCRLR